MGAIELMRKECLRRRYSLETVKAYSYCVGKFLRRNSKEVKKTTKVDVQRYLDYLVERGASASTLNVNLSALKFLFEEILGKKLTVKVKFAKVPKRLPDFLTKEEIKKLFEAIGNPKHKLMIELLYSTGMRVSELVNLKVEDLCLNEGYGWVRQGKGNKDRPMVVAERIRTRLSERIIGKKLESGDFVFQSYCGKYSTSTIRKILERAAKESGISKRVHPHMLRHSFATHLVEEGNGVDVIQPLLGHNRIETTMVYLHASPKRFLSVKSPYDSL
ncbi:tyrosine-type recombinase/integrase [Candidatus Woesearchaeota archaeon]|jgi:integrase/recombinase XerD|nr:tyrosine-type recombinase/integrase [Candidatus Woesearchaeota archaeon]